MGSGGGARAVFEEGLKEGASGLLDGADPLVARLRSKPRGHDGLSFAGGEQFLAIGLTCGGGFASDPGVCTAWIGGSGLGEALGAKAKPRWGTRRFVLQRNGVTTAARNSVQQWRGRTGRLQGSGALRRKGVA